MVGSKGSAMPSTPRPTNNQPKPIQRYLKLGASYLASSLSHKLSRDRKRARRLGCDLSLPELALGEGGAMQRALLVRFSQLRLSI